MRVTLLISALKADTDKLIEKMNFKTDAVIVNQCDEDGREEIDENDRKRHQTRFGEFSGKRAEGNQTRH